MRVRGIISSAAVAALASAGLAVAAPMARATAVPGWNLTANQVVAPGSQPVTGTDPGGAGSTVTVTFSGAGGVSGSLPVVVAPDDSWSTAIDTSGWGPGTYAVSVGGLLGAPSAPASTLWVLSPTTAGVSVTMPTSPVTSMQFGYLDVGVTVDAGWDPSSVTGSVAFENAPSAAAPVLQRSPGFFAAYPDPSRVPNGAANALVVVRGLDNGIATTVVVEEPFTLALTTTLTNVSVSNVGYGVGLTATITDWDPSTTATITLDGVGRTADCQVRLTEPVLPGTEPSPGGVFCSWYTVQPNTFPAVQLIPDGSHTLRITGVGRTGPLDSGPVDVTVDTLGHLALDSAVPDPLTSGANVILSGPILNVPVNYNSVQNLTLTISGTGVATQHLRPEISSQGRAVAVFQDPAVPYTATISGLDLHGNQTCASATVSAYVVTAVSCSPQPPSPPTAVTAVAGAGLGTATVTATPPATGTVTGYTATVIAPDNGGTTVVHSVGPVFSLTGLLMSGDYLIQVSADNAVGPSPAVPVYLFEQNVGMATSVTSVRYGSPLTVDVLLGTTQNEHGTATVDFQFRASTTQAWATIATHVITSNAATLTSFALTLPGSGYYRPFVRARGAFLAAPGPSSTLITVVPLAAPTLKVHLSATSVRRGAIVAVTASVSGHVSGSKAVLQHLVRGRWVSVTSALVSSRNTAILKVKASSVGRTSWRVVIPAVTGRMYGTVGRALLLTVR